MGSDSNASNGAAVFGSDDIAMQSSPADSELVRIVAIVFQHGSKLPPPFVCGELRLVNKPELKAWLVRLNSILSFTADDCLS